MHDSPRLRAFLESLSGLSGRQWRTILALLVCANLIVYAALGMLLYRYVLTPPPVPEIERTPTPTLRPTFTPTWTPTSSMPIPLDSTPAPMATATANRATSTASQ